MKARWEPTPEQVVKQAREYLTGYAYQLVRVPITRIEFDDYGAVKYAGTRDGTDVERLATLMHNGIALPPASGYADATWYGPTDGLYGVTDGNHRISAAKRVGLKTVPMIVPTGKIHVRANPGPSLVDRWWGAV